MRLPQNCVSLTNGYPQVAVEAEELSGDLAFTRNG
jgi:hypothetical protein